MPDPSKFAQTLGSDSFIVTCELDPPKGFAPSLVDRKIAILKEKVQAIVVSDNPKARMYMAPLGFCRYLLEQGLEPIMTMTCRDRNRLALQSDLLAAAGLGIQNILAVTGDYVTWGDHPEGKPVYDLDSIQLIWAISQLNSNKDISGNVVEGPPPLFTIGAAVTLTGHPVGPPVLKFRKKEKAGVHFFMSHPIFELTDAEEFFKEAVDIKNPLLATVFLLTEEQIRGYALGNYPGLLIPESLSDKLKSIPSTEFQSRMIEYAGNLIETIKKDRRFRGVHLMLQGAEERIGELI
jgi:methylenetetrahydrofolate reductase (NADPH)